MTSSPPQASRGLAMALCCAAVVVAGALLASCSSYRVRPQHPHLAVAWRDYRALPDQRALAIAGDPREDRWVTGASGGHASQSGAERGALLECRRRRAARRMRAPCVLYALGDEIVWVAP